MNSGGLLWDTHKIPSIFKINILSISFPVRNTQNICLHLSCRMLEHPQQRLHPWMSVFAEQLIAFNDLKVLWVIVENTAGNECSRFVPVEDYHREIMTVWATAYIRMLILKDQQNGKTKQQKKTVPGFPSSPKPHLCGSSHAWHMARIFGWTSRGFALYGYFDYLN